MALTGTRMLEMRPASDNLDKNMNRLSQYGAIDTFIIGNSEAESIVSPELSEKARMSAGRAVKIPVLDYKGVTLGSTRSVTIADDDNTSALVTVTWNTYTFGFTIVPTLHQNNEISMQRDFNKKAMAGFQALADQLDNLALSTLSTNKTQVFGGTTATELGYSIANDSLRGAASTQDEILGDASVVMRSNDYYSDRYRCIANPGMDSRLQKILEHAVYNDQNRTLQVRDKTFHFSNRLANDSGVKASAYLVQPGNLGYLIQHEREALVGRRTSDGHEWGITTDPILGLPIDYYSYEGVTDESTRLSEADMTRVYKEHHAFAMTIGLVTSYNTAIATHANPIMLVEVTTA